MSDRVFTVAALTEALVQINQQIQELEEATGMTSEEMYGKVADGELDCNEYFGWNMLLQRKFIIEMMLEDKDG